MKRYQPYQGEETKEAAALKYEEGKDLAPRITALGRGYLAERMVKEAESNQIQVVKDEGLSHMLHSLSVGDAIPEELYCVVAEILAFVYRMDGRTLPGQDLPDKE
ncbi:MAG: EscU/YscU/HrcU family type III secretion system export apparatus switch protein [Christensenellales bacterium]|jgi:flagellar biosynthesis protein